MTRKLPTKPGLYYAKIDGKQVVVRMDENMMCWHDNIGFGVENLYVKWFGEAVPTVDELRQLRAKASELEKRVEFLEWMGEELNFRGRITFEYCHGSTGVLLNPSEKGIVAWPGLLRDGWQHWDTIKEAVK